MKLSGRDARRMIDAPDPAAHGFLLHGADPSAVALRRERLVEGLLGEAADDMALTRLDAAAARRDPASLSDALLSISFFGGRRVVVLTEATDGMAKLVGEALGEGAGADAVLVVSAGSLAARSALRKLFESRKSLISIGIYADPPSRSEIEDALARLGAPAPDADGAADLVALGRALDVGEMQAFLEKLALYKSSEEGPITAADVAACAPLATEEAVDAVVSAAAGGRLDALATGMSRLAGQGTAPTTLSIAVSRHFRQLHALATAPGGPEAAIGRIRPPVWGPRREALVEQARRWSVAGLERTLSMLADVELELRSSGGPPPMAVLERTLVRIALIGRRRA